MAPVLPLPPTLTLTQAQTLTLTLTLTPPLTPGAGCTGPGADECTTCLEPPPPSPPPSPLPSSPPVEVPDLPDFPEEPPEEEETEEDVEIVPPTSCGAGTCKKGEYSNSGSCAPCDACCDSCSGPVTLART
jgi:hypothetical protein